MNEKEIDAHLDETALKQLTWKPSVVRNIAVRIALRALEENDRIFWADEIDLAFVGKNDVQCIGTAWRMLQKAGILKRTNLNRRSTKDASKGRVVFKYRLASEKRARTFLTRNGWTGKVGADGERLLFAAEELSGAGKIPKPENPPGPIRDFENDSASFCFGGPSKYPEMPQSSPVDSQK